MGADGWRRAVTRIARGQHGVWTRQQALDAGEHRRTLDGHIASGRVELVLPGVLVAPGTPRTLEVRAMAAQLWAGPDSALSHRTAAGLVGLTLPGSGAGEQVHLITSRRRATPAGHVVHHSRHPVDDQRVGVGPLLVTDPDRTACDLAGDLDRRALRRLVAQLVREGRTDAGSLRARAADLGPFAGRGRLRTVLDELSPLEADCRSELESSFLRLVTRARIPPTAMNHPVVDAEGRRRFIDAVWLPEHVGVELDSREQHGSLVDWNDDLRRETAIVLGGPWRQLLRFSWWDVRDHGPDVVRHVRLALDTRKGP